METRSFDECFPDLKRFQLDTPPQPPGECIVTAIGSSCGGTGVSTLTAYLARYTALGLERSHKLEKDALLGRRQPGSRGFFERVRMNQDRVHFRNSDEPTVDRRKVLVIEASSNRQVARYLGLWPDPKRTLLNVALGDCDMDDCIDRVNEYLHLLPTSGSLDQLEEHLYRQEAEPFRSALEEMSRLSSSLPAGELQAAKISGLAREAEVGSATSLKWLRDALAPLRRKYARIYIDLSWASSLLAQSALVAADNVICMVRPSERCWVDAEQFLTAVGQAKPLNPSLYVVGILVNMMKKQRPRIEYGLEGIKSEFGNLVMPVVEDYARIAATVEEGVSVRDGNIKRQMSALLGELFAREEARRLGTQSPA